MEPGGGLGGDQWPAGRERRAAANQRGGARAGHALISMRGAPAPAENARREREARRGPPTPPPPFPTPPSLPPPTPPNHTPPVPFAAGAAGAWAVHGHRQEHAAHPRHGTALAPRAERPSGK